MTYEGRKALFKCLVGSHNYNLNDAQSDKDYKIFVAPTFDDLYFNKQFSTSSITDTEDCDVHDIRKISSLFYKSNINFVESLFSEKFEVKEDLSAKTKMLIGNIYEMRHDIAKMNLPYLYEACVGMHIQKKLSIDKPTKGTKYLYDKFGYDTKAAMHSIRVLDFLLRFKENNFTDFKKAIWYDNDDKMRSILLGIKNGIVPKDSYLMYAEKMLSSVENTCKSAYKSHSLNNDTNNELIGIIQAIVKENIA